MDFIPYSELIDFLVPWTVTTVRAEYLQHLLWILAHGSHLALHMVMLIYQSVCHCSEISLHILDGEKVDADTRSPPRHSH